MSSSESTSVKKESHVRIISNESGGILEYEEETLKEESTTKNHSRLDSTASHRGQVAESLVEMANQASRSDQYFQLPSPVGYWPSYSPRNNSPYPPPMNQMPASNQSISSQYYNYPAYYPGYYSAPPVETTEAEPGPPIALVPSAPIPPPMNPFPDYYQYQHGLPSPHGLPSTHALPSPTSLHNQLPPHPPASHSSHIHHVPIHHVPPIQTSPHLPQYPEREVKEEVVAKPKAKRTPKGTKKDLACSMCGKTFTRRFNLKAHENAHQDIKNFECSVCKQRFTRRHDLVRHERLHTGKTPYVCEICKKGFTRVESWNRHRKTGCGTSSQATSQRDSEEEDD